MITLNEARKIIAAAEQKAKELGQPMNIAIADAGGNLIAHVRQTPVMKYNRGLMSRFSMTASGSARPPMPP